MTTKIVETFPVVVHFKVNNVLNIDKDETFDPIVTISVNDSVVLENVVLNEPDSMVNFDMTLDDDIEQTIKLKIDLMNENIPLHDDWGIFVSDIELNEISVETLVHENSILDVPLCEEADYAEEGFIQSYLIPEKLDDKLILIDGKYHYITNGDYIHMQDSSYSFTFKTPLYLWLLELLLQ